MERLKLFWAYVRYVRDRLGYSWRNRCFRRRWGGPIDASELAYSSRKLRIAFDGWLKRRRSDG